MSNVSVIDLGFMMPRPMASMPAEESKSTYQDWARSALPSATPTQSGSSVFRPPLTLAQRIERAKAQQAAGTSKTAPGPSAPAASGMSTRTKYIIGGVAVAGVLALVLLHK